MIILHILAWAIGIVGGFYIVTTVIDWTIDLVECFIREWRGK